MGRPRMVLLAACLAADLANTATIVSNLSGS
jgi:hypothetical protein